MTYKLSELLEKSLNTAVADIVNEMLLYPESSEKLFDLHQALSAIQELRGVFTDNEEKK